MNMQRYMIYRVQSLKISVEKDLIAHVETVKHDNKLKNKQKVQPITNLFKVQPKVDEKKIRAELGLVKTIA